MLRRLESCKEGMEASRRFQDRVLEKERGRKQKGEAQNP
jgi:hypothetical protein